MDSLQVLWLPPIVQTHACDSKLAVSMNGRPAADWRPVRGIPHLSACDSSNTPTSLNWISGEKNAGMVTNAVQLLQPVQEVC